MKTINLYRRCKMMLACMLVLCAVTCKQKPQTLKTNVGTYCGSLEKGRPEGYGVMTYTRATAHTPRTYKGEWADGLPHGFGTFVYGNGDCYAGQVRVGKRSGRGVFYRKNGQMFDGTWKNDSLRGYGVLTDSVARYQGEWEAFALDSGRIAYANGDVYEGYINANYREDGQGIMAYAEGSVYNGYWNNGVRSGFGICTGVDGRVRSGQWKEDAYMGERLQHSKKRVYGIDISRHQHKNDAPIYWKYLKIVRLGSHHDESADAALPLPVSFALIKATEGRGLVNPYFKADYAQARRYGIVRGAYHFFNSSPVDLQVQNYISTVHLAKGDFPPILDLEPSPKHIEEMGGEEQMLRNALAWLKAVERHYGVRPILYVSQNFVTKTLQHAPEDFRLYDYWIARYSAYSPAVDVNFWQLDADGAVIGISGPVDINLYNGSRAQFRHFLAVKGPR